jgi:hypothetical protein
MNHKPQTCQGCDEVLHLDDLSTWLRHSTHTLYKWASVGYPAFPRRLPGRTIAVTCVAAKAWLREMTK